MCVDSLLNGHKGNLEELLGHERFECVSPLTVHGDGTQTRSLCYDDDLIEGCTDSPNPSLSAR